MALGLLPEQIFNKKVGQRSVSSLFVKLYYNYSDHGLSSAFQS